MSLKILDKETFLSEYSKVENLLLGNGFCLSHPKLQETYKKLDDDRNFDVSLTVKGGTFPEGSLNEWRRELCKKIIKEYFEAYRDTDGKLSLHQYPQSCDRFINRRKKIFTLNYDPLLYTNHIKYLKMLKFKNKISDTFLEMADGFSGKTFSSKQNIVDRIKSMSITGCVIYYLHGAWFIQEKKDDRDKLRKITIRHDVTVVFEDICNDIAYPHIILEDRSKVKEILIEEDVYFRFCLEQLENLTGDLLCFGCSFKTDAHIVKAIDNNSGLNNIYITICDVNDKEEIRKKFKQKDKELTFIHIEDNVIWS